MRTKYSLIVELAGVAAVLVGLVIGGRHLNVDLPILFGLGATLVGRYLIK